MKKFLLTLILGISCCSGFSNVAHAQAVQFKPVPVSIARPEIQACYNRYTLAIKTKDINALGGLLAPDYISYSLEGRQTDRDHLLNFYNFLFRLPSKYSRYETRITSIEPRGVDWIVTSQTVIESAPSKAGSMKATVNCRDYWGPTKHPNRWTLRQNVEISADIWMNGKKIM